MHHHRPYRTVAQARRDETAFAALAWGAAGLAKIPIGHDCPDCGYDNGRLDAGRCDECEAEANPESLSAIPCCRCDEPLTHRAVAEQRQSDEWLCDCCRGRDYSRKCDAEARAGRGDW